MTNKNKALMLVLSMALIVVASVFTTLAYFTAQDTVTNTFTVGDIEITLDETKVTPDGKVDTTVSTRVKENEYHLLPGHSYIKDPTIHVTAGNEDCYLYVEITNNLTNTTLEAAYEVGTVGDEGYKNYGKISDQLKANGWKVLAGNVYYYVGTDTANDNGVIVTKESARDYVVFNGFKIQGTGVTATDLAAVESDKAITVKAYAIQADGFASASAAWEAAGTEAQSNTSNN